LGVAAAVGAVAPQACAAGVTGAAVSAVGPKSETASRFADWVVASHDNRRKPFVIVDKIAAQVLVFDAKGRMTGSTPALLGMAAGDDPSPGVGEIPLSAIPPSDRTTPAGRFLAAFKPDHKGAPVLWVDYKTAIALHPTPAGGKDGRLQRLASPTAEDNRVTFGCINVPARFYKAVVRPAFKGGQGVVYVLPDTKPIAQVFPKARVPEPTPPVVLAIEETPAAPVEAAPRKSLFGRLFGKK
jgi:hypothetical protein